jgi:hypothetical protein
VANDFNQNKITWISKHWTGSSWHQMLQVVAY